MITTILTAIKSAKLWLTLGGYLIAAVLFWAWQNGREELASEIERCNTRTMQSVAEAERITKETATAAYEARLAQKEAQITSERNARQIADKARVEAESRPERVKTVIRELKGDANACLDTVIPAELVDGLRS